MTCRCPAWQCYFRTDCRRGERQAKKPRGPKPAPNPQPIAAARLMWLEGRHDALVEELQGELRPAERKSKASALSVINAAIARHSVR